MNDQELYKQLRTIFIQEAKERLNSIINCLIEIEQGCDETEIESHIETIFRDMHSLKGAARSINLIHFEGVFQILESFMSDIKKHALPLSGKITGILQDVANELDQVVVENDLSSLDRVDEVNNIKECLEVALKDLNKNEPVMDNKTKVPDRKIDILIPDENNQPDELVETDKAEQGPEAEIIADKCEEKKIDEGQGNEVKNTTMPSQKNERKISSSNETVRIASNKLDSLLIKSENMIQLKQMFQDNVHTSVKLALELDNIMQEYGKVQPNSIFLKQYLRERTGGESSLDYRHLKAVLDFYELFGESLKNFKSSIKSLNSGSKENFRNCEKVIDNFLLDMKEVAMLPFSNILAAFPRMIKDISKGLNKNINFQITGETNQIDRRILQELSDPLIHIIRNCIDHGIESPGIREKLGKTAAGNVKLLITQTEGNKVEILVEDDGKGIDDRAVKNKLLQDNMISEEELKKLNRDDLIEYLFFSGFSTKEIITDISGRGLGLAIVKEKLEKLGGKIEINSEVDKGTQIKLILPVALSTFKGVLVGINTKTFVVPSVNVEKVIRIINPEIKTIENKDSITYIGTTYPIIDLSGILALPEIESEEENIEQHDNANALTAVIVKQGNKFMALKVDSVMEEREILVKDLGTQLQKVYNISAASILNSGEIVFILNVHDLFSAAQSLDRITRPSAAAKTDKVMTVQRGKANKVLVVEDSITSRILLKNILESSGYMVDTAVDGVAALTLLKTKKVNIIVSDIEMPRMDGISLTKTIRADNELKELPVILVTSLSSDKDKERGIDAGANAYIMKSQFDQSNLLSTIQTLLE